MRTRSMPPIAQPSRRPREMGHDWVEAATLATCAPAYDCADTMMAEPCGFQEDLCSPCAKCIKR